MASAEIKVVIIALLILVVGFFYTNVRDKMTGYASVQKDRSIYEIDFATEEPDQTLSIKQTSAPSKGPTKEEFSLQTLFPNAQPVDPCSADVPQLRTLVGGIC